MRVLVPITGSARSPQPLAGASVFLSACLLACAACSPTPTATVDTGGGATGGITVTITTPATPDPAGTDVAPPWGSSIGVSGTYKLDAGVTLKKTAAISVAVGDKFPTPVPCTATPGKSGQGTFSCAIDTTGVDATGVPLIACNESLTLTVTANGTLAGLDVSGSNAVDVEVDNCGPTIVLNAVKKLSAEPFWQVLGPEMQVFVGHQWLSVSASDARLQSVTFDVVDGNGDSVLPGGMYSTATPGQTQWGMPYLLDTTQLAATEKLTVIATAKDETNDAVQVSLDVFSVRSVSFLGQQTDSFSHKINDFVVPSADQAQEFVAYTSDPTPSSGLDKLADAVVATDNGVYIRAGMPKRVAGVPITVKGEGVPDGNSDTLAHSLKFEDLNEDPKTGDALAPYRCIHPDPLLGSAGTSANIARVFLRDLDGDGDLDIIAVGTTSGSGKPRGEAWAILNVPVNVTDKTSQKPFTIRGFKLMQVLPLPARPATAEMADLNGDGLDDLLIGAQKEPSETGPDIDNGLMTLLLTPSPTCQVRTDTGVASRPCGDSPDPNVPPIEYAALKGGTVFAPDVKVAPNMGVTSVVSIATGDFWTGEGVDVCVGSADRPILSCYRNVAMDGSLNQAQDSYQFPQGNDTNLILAMDETPKLTTDGTDLIVASATGHYMQWLKSINNGQFKIIGNQGLKARQIWGPDVSAMTIAPVGPKGEPYVVAGMMGQEVTIIPVDPGDNELERACFRSWIVGGSAHRLGARDMDGDGVLDLLTTDGYTIHTALGETKNGAFTGSFIAPSAHHLCAFQTPSRDYGVQEIVAAKVADFSKNGKDKRKELVVIGTSSASEQLGTASMCGLAEDAPPKPVWPIAVFMNDTGQINPEPRQTEFSPYDAAFVQQAGFAEDCSKGNPVPFGHVNAATLADVDMDGIPDLVTVRTESGYPVGQEEPASNPGGCQCFFGEQNEVDNGFGEDSPAGTDLTSEQLALCCANFGTKDTDKTTPLTGFGTGSGIIGAPFPRASTQVFLSSSAGPLGMGPKCNALPNGGVCLTAPAFAFSGGRNPVDVRAVDIDGDKKPDIITAMDNDGAACFKNVPDYAPFLHSRVRVFQNIGGGRFSPTFIADTKDKSSLRDAVQIARCGHPLTIGTSIVGYRFMPDQLKAIVTGAWPNPKDGKFDPATIFGLAKAFGQIGVLPHLDTFNFASRSPTPVGGPPDAFSVGDINADGIADLLVLFNAGQKLAILTGKTNNDNTKDAAFHTLTELTVANATFPGAAAAAMGDFNADSNLDLALVGLDSSLVFLLGTGMGTFVAYTGSPVATSPLALEVADMDGDGCDDMVIRSKNSVTIIHNEGSTAGACSGALTWAHDQETAANAP